MRFIESNYRYKMYSAGFHYILEFRTRVFADRQLYPKLVKSLEDIYGPVRKELPPREGEAFKRYEMNENWRIETMTSQKKRRIYLKDGSAYTMASLKIT